MDENTLKRKGLVFDIQRFCVHDGPGIRTTVFLKGCPLNCLWCANPESVDPFPILITRDIKCVRCGACKEVCSSGAITFNENDKREINWAICNQCLECVDACIFQALNACGNFMSIEEIFDEVIRDKKFYDNSNGGVTISGGEPLQQWQFVSELCKILKKNDLHVAIETTGFAPWKHFEQILENVDFFLYDVKHLDPKKHVEGTSVKNDLILSNLHKLSETSKIWIRIPLIAAYNDTEENIKNVVKLAKEIRAEKISLLPYHEGGKSKCAQIGKLYRMPHAKAPSEEHVQKLKEFIISSGINVSIGN